MSVLKEFSIRQRDTTVEYLADSPDVQNAAQSIKVFVRPFLDNRLFDKGSNIPLDFQFPFCSGGNEQDVEPGIQTKKSIQLNLKPKDYARICMLYQYG